jgi:hypothetical protein
MFNVRLRLAAELGTVVCSMAAFVLTLLNRDWIEVLFRVDPDHGNGSAEWLILGFFLAVALITLVLASIEWRRLRIVAVDSR